VKVTHCRSCGDRIIWAVTTKGKRIPLDADPVADGNIVIIGMTLHRDPLVSVGLTHGDVPAGEKSYVTHFVTCKDADSWRKRDRR